MINKSLLGCSVALLGSLPFASLQAKQAQSQKKNVLFLIVDDLRPELNCYGAKHMVTPAIDKLASEGVMFENAYCNVPVSGASRASLFSGLRPGKSRYWDVTAEIDIEAPGTITLPQHFRENGYVTISNSKVIHGKDDAKARSWDEHWMPDSHSATWRDYLGKENLNVEKQKGGPTAYEALDVADNAYIDGKTADKAIADLQKLKKSGKPFFMATGIVKPHLPFNAPKKYWDMYNREQIRMPETFEFDRTGIPQAAFHNYNEIRFYNGIPAKADIPVSEGIALIHGYRACVSYADAQVGKILDELKRLGLDKNTIVVLIGDHGWSLGDHNQWCKHSNFNIVNNAPLIMRTPGNKKKGAEAKVVEFVDIYPTLCEEAGIPTPEHTEGRSFSKLLRGKDANWKDCAIVKWHKGVTYFDRTYGYTEWRNQNNELEDQMLFIYSNDPAETRNVAEQPKNAEVIKRLQKKIEIYRGENYFVKTARPQPHKKAKK